MTIRLMIIALLTCMAAPCVQAMQKGKRKAETAIEETENAPVSKKAKKGSKKSNNNSSSSSSSQQVTPEELEQEETNIETLYESALEEINVVESQLDKSEARSEKLKKKLKQKSEIIAQQAETLNNAMQDIDELTHQKEQLEVENKRNKAEIALLKAVAQQPQAFKHTLNTLTEQFNKITQQQAVKNAKLQVQAQQAIAMAEALQTEKTALSQQVDDLQKSLKDILDDNKSDDGKPYKTMFA